MLKIILAALMMVEADAVLCTTAPAYQPQVCMANANTVPYNYVWHCPWESGGLVVNYGCDAVKYDCSADIQTILNLYTAAIAAQNTFDFSPAQGPYVVACLKSQCQGGPAPGPKPARRLVTV